jgi:mannose-1-phosphate guanylyltransferase
VSEPSLWVVILAGGTGSRFWPVSTPSRPKQLLPLAGPDTLILQTVERVRPLVDDSRIRILTGASLERPIREAVPGLGPDSFLIEPTAKGTAPVLAWAAAEIERIEPGAVMASLHADNVISPAVAFRSQLARIAAASASHRRLFTIGVTPTRPETGYGYIEPGRSLGDDESFQVDRFVEKPDEATAKAYVERGFLWNTGSFVWPAALLLEELRAHTPEIAVHLPLLDDGRIGEFFANVPSITIDVALLERSDRIAVARAAFEWDDVGAWDAVARTREADAAGNVAVGDAHFVESENCIAWSESGSVVTFGASDMIVVHSGGITFVAPRHRAPELKKLLDRLPASLKAPPGGDG